MIKVLFFKSLDHKPEVLEIENNTKSFEELVGGTYAIVDSLIDKNIVIIVNENEIDFSSGFPLKVQHFFVKKTAEDNRFSFYSLTDVEIKDLVKPIF